MNNLTYIKCGKLYDGITPTFQENMAILVKDNKIEALAPQAALSCPEEAQLIDLSDATVTPGMIDAHMHMDYFDWRHIREEVYNSSEEMKTIAIIRTA